VGIRSKIERSKKHVADLDFAIRDFHNSDPYKVAAKRDPDTRKLIYYVSHVEIVPDEVTQIAGDAIGNMISILDHLAFRLYLKHTPGGDGRHVYFPIARKATNTTEYKSARKGKIEGIDPIVVIPALDALEPYKGGKGHDLWVLNELNNLAKHRDLIAVGSQFRSVDIGAYGAALLEKTLGHPIPEIHAFFQVADTLCPLKVGHELFIGAPDDEVNEKMQFRFEVAINEPQITQAKPLIETVHQLSGVVDSIVSQFAKYL
jgi:hypothetical protein